MKAPLIPQTAPVDTNPVRAAAKRTPPPLTIVRNDEHVRGFAEGVSARLLDELASGRMLPGRELDLHGMRAAQARAALTRAVDEAHRDGVACLLVICGRGRHSEGEPVLPEVAIERLGELGEHVLAFCTSPPRLGGSGAVLVRLRAR